ncbi:LytR/AlgR family response regulator transcription factor [Pedobacter jamesrossensis]|uniref:LytR/AlgR family response regulator transcription factor n=1 Tax=Pedobacter jamesrossensis TaxID=1908238 RepID=A0ABV8NMM9_9SPHI
MQCIIIDDSAVARTTLSFLCEQVKDLLVLAEFTGAIEAYSFLSEKDVDLLFLDIEMPGMNGIELARNLSARCPLIIFTTSKKEYAIDAFDLHVADYLVKPVMPSRFFQAVDRVREALENRESKVIMQGCDFVFVRESGMIRKVEIAEICYLEAMGDYVKIITSSKLHVVHSTLKTLEGKLPPNLFLRVHRSFIISIAQIDYMQESSVRMCERFIPVGDNYKKLLFQRMNML